MKEEIEVLNRFVDNQKQYCDKLEEFYNAQTIILKDITDYQTSKLKVNADGLYLFAVELEKTEKKSAHELYRISADFGSTPAKRNYASALICDKNGTPTQLEEAIQLLKEVVKQDKEIPVHYLFGRAYYLLNQYPLAYYHFKEVDQKNPEFKKVKPYLEVYNALPATILNELFKFAGKVIVPPEFLKSKPEKIMPWYTITHKFDACDCAERVDILFHYRELQIELDFISEKIAIYEAHLKIATSNKEPKKTTISLSLQIIEAKAQLSAISESPELLIPYKQLLRTPQEEEHLRQVHTEERFFSPLRTHAELTKTIAFQLLQNALVTDPASVVPIEEMNVPGRQMLTAELARLQTLFYVYGKEQNHVGDFVGPKIPYKRIRKHLLRLSSGTEEKPNLANEKQIAKWMMRYLSPGIKVTLEELQNMHDSATQKDLNKLHRIFYYCLIKEPAIWKVIAGESQQLPYATAQAVAVKLVAEGEIDLKKVFDSNAPYGIFSDVNIAQNIDKIPKKILLINTAYKLFLARDKKEEKRCSKFKKKHPKSELVVTREHWHSALGRLYGGRDDTDGEGYDSDIDESLSISNSF